MAGTAKAVKAAPRKAAKATQPIPIPAHAFDADEPEELRDLYGPPVLRRGGAGADGYEPIELSTPTRQQQRKVPKKPLFYLDGVEYGIPAQFPPALALLYLDGIEEGRDVALGRVLKVAIGTEGWGALMTYVKAGGDIGEQAMAAMLGYVLQLVMGAIERGGEGNG